MVPKVHQIVAMDDDFGIGRSDVGGIGIPWNLPDEFARFLRIISATTNSDTKNAWIMGRKTFEQHFLSPEGIFKKFSHSVVKVVLTRSWSKLPEGWEDSQLTYICRNWDEGRIENAWNIGGPAVYRAQLEQDPKLLVGTQIFVTKVQGSFGCDIFYPRLDFDKLVALGDNDEGYVCHVENDVTYTYRTYQFT